MAAKNDYFDLSRLVSLILALIPFTSWICGALTRFQEGKIVPAVVRIVVTVTGVGALIIWVLDLVYILDAVLMVLNGRILRIL